ncbi:MAG: ribosomal-processing cysteine protease Prp [Bacteroides sp.]|nr:ribosomal-processing cysteine protease Prp [Prevotella sp.]MCM1408356.1 ribosomal-processing cysteine protease Prp [Treponema brennaborense]MCM1470413.1 ribosomal-processing cysteine protease Prp [Bacteroides sp.]
MVHVRLMRGTDGKLRACTASGHAGYSVRGSDVVCAGVSTLMRTTLAVLEKQPGIVLEFGGQSERGKLEFHVTESGLCKCGGVLKYAADFLAAGFSALQEEYPEFVNLAEA